MYGTTAFEPLISKGLPSMPDGRGGPHATFVVYQLAFGERSPLHDTSGPLV
jgi:hypothetical protein